MTEGNESAPAEQGEAVEQTAVESIQQGKPNIMMDKEVASDMASKASEANDVESGDPVEQGLSKGLKMSGVAGDPVAAPKNQIAQVAVKEEKTSARVSPVADVPADAQVNTEDPVKESSVASNQPENVEEAQEEPEKVEEAQEEPEKVEEAQEEPENVEEAQEEPEKVEEVQEEPEREKEVQEELEKEKEVQEEPKQETEAQEEPEKEEEEPENNDQEESEIPEGSQPEGEAEPEEYTPFGDPLRNVVENMPQKKNVPIDRMSTEDSKILLSDIPGKLRIY